MKDYMKLVLVAVFFAVGLLPKLTYCQCSADYALLIQEGDLHFELGNFALAVDKYQAAKISCPDSVELAQVKVLKITRKLDEMREFARVQDSLIKAMWEYSVALWDTIVVLQEAITMNDHRIESADSQMAVLMQRFLDAQKRVENLKDSLIVARSRAMTLCKEFVGGKEVFYYIDRNGVEIDSIGRFTEAEQFNEDGFALVRTRKGRFLLDHSSGEKQRTSKRQFSKRNRAIDLSGKKLKQFPKKLYRMKQLVVLLASRNNIHKVKRRFARFSHLKYLNIEDNRLRNIKRITRADSLERAKFSGNNLHTIPRRIRKLHQLWELDLSHNEIEKIRKQTFQLEALKVFNVAFNRVESIDDSIAQLYNLLELDLSFNQLTQLPPTIVKLKKLKYLSLTGNQFGANWEDDLLVQLRQLPSLKILRLGLNPCSDTEIERENIRRSASEFMPHCFVLFN